MADELLTEDQAVSDLLDALEELAQTAENAFDSAKEALNIETVTAEVSEGLGRVRDDILRIANEGAGEVAGMLQQVAGAIGSASVAVADITSIVTDVQEDIAEKFKGVTESVGKISAEHATAKDSADTVLNRLVDGVTAATDNIDDLVEVVRGKVEDIFSAMIGELTNNLVEPVQEMGEQCVGKITKLVEKIADEILPEKVNEIVEQWSQELRAELAGTIDEMQGALGSFRESVISGTAAAGDSRATSEMAMGLLRTALAPVTSQLGRVSGLAETVGISI